LFLSFLLIAFPVPSNSSERWDGNALDMADNKNLQRSSTGCRGHQSNIKWAKLGEWWMANDSDLPGLLVLHARHRPDLWVLRHDTPYALMDTYAIFKTRIIWPSVQHACRSWTLVSVRAGKPNSLQPPSHQQAKRHDWFQVIASTFDLIFIVAIVALCNHRHALCSHTLWRRAGLLRLQHRFHPHFNALVS
jgi:hypothetical protein